MTNHIWLRKDIYLVLKTTQKKESKNVNISVLLGQTSKTWTHHKRNFPWRHVISFKAVEGNELHGGLFEGVPTVVPCYPNNAIVIAGFT